MQFRLAGGDADQVEQVTLAGGADGELLEREGGGLGDQPAGGSRQRLKGGRVRLPAAERRCVVLSHMAGASVGEIAAIEQVSLGTVQARLARARQVVTEGMADVLPEVLGSTGFADDHPDDAAPGTYESGLYAGYDDKGDQR